MTVGPVGGGGGKPRAVVAPNVSKPAAEPAAPPASKPKPAADAFIEMAKLVQNVPGVGPFVGPILLGASAVAGALAQITKDTAKLTEMKDLLKGSPTGAAAVKFLEDKKVPVEFANGGGSYWDGTKIVIDRTEKMEESALTLVHELHHAKEVLGGTAPNVKTMSRADYVAGELKEEAQGTVNSIKAKNELKASGAPITATFPLETQYNQAFKKASDELKATKPTATAAELNAAGEKAGAERVLKGFKDGEVRTSTNKKPYSEYYGTVWDKEHPKAK